MITASESETRANHFGVRDTKAAIISDLAVTETASYRNPTILVAGCSASHPKNITEVFNRMGQH